MGDFASYSAYQPTAEEQMVTQHKPEQHHERTHTSITVRDGQTVSETSGVQRVSTADLSPYTDWRSTARTQSGFPTMEVTGDSLVTINGMEGTVKSFVMAGVISKDYATATATGEGSKAAELQDHRRNDPQETPSVDPDVVSHPPEMVEAIQASVADVPQHAYDSAMVAGMAMATGAVSMDDVVQGLSRNSGMDPSKAAQVVEFNRHAYQNQADAFLTSSRGGGLSRDELPGFYEYCRSRNNVSTLKQAIEGQVHTGSMAGYRALLDGYMRNVAPDPAALSARGFETKRTDKGTMVRIRGQWMSLAVAAKTGLV